MTTWRDRVILILLVGAIVIAAAPVVSATPTPPATAQLADAQKAQADVFAGIARARTGLDRAQFDLDALGLELGGEAADIAEFVRDEIAFEQYPGLLRGAQGTLVARAGNALDQAVLLHQLLSDAGYETRLARGRLTPAQARALTLRMFAPRKPALPVARDLAKLRAALTGPGAAPDPALDAAFKTLTAPPDMAASQMYSDTRSDVTYFDELLDKAGVSLGDARAEPVLADEARDYFWVEYRLTDRDPWQQAHPAFGGADAPQNLVATETYADATEIPASLRHRIRVEARLERAAGGKLEEVPLFRAYTADAADEFARPHSFAIVADGFTSEADFANPRAALKKSRYFYPALDGALVKDAAFFDLQGNLVPPSQAQSPLAALLGKGGAFDQLNDLFGGSSDATSAPAATSDLTAVYLDYTFEAPGQAPHTYRRVLMDRIGRDARAAGKLAVARPQDPAEDLLDLTARQTFMVSTGALAPAFVADRNLAHLERIRPLLDLALIGNYRQQTDQEMGALYTLGDLTWPDFLNLYQLFDAGALRDAVTYRSAPGLVVHGQRQDGAKITAWTDVVSNARRAYRLQGGKIVAAPDALLHAGVWDTRTEGVFLPPGVGDDANTLRALARAYAQKIPIRVLTPADKAVVAGLRIPEGARKLVSGELAAGNAVILPERALTGAGQYGWLRVNPQDGLSLGMMETGRGQEFIEQVMLGTATGTACIWSATNGLDWDLSDEDIVKCMLAGAVANLQLTSALTVRIAAAAVLGGYLAGWGSAPGPVTGN